MYQVKQQSELVQTCSAFESTGTPTFTNLISPRKRRGERRLRRDQGARNSTLSRQPVQYRQDYSADDDLACSYQRLKPSTLTNTVIFLVPKQPPAPTMNLKVDHTTSHTTVAPPRSPALDMLQPLSHPRLPKLPVSHVD